MNRWLGAVMLLAAGCGTTAPAEKAATTTTTWEGRCTPAIPCGVALPYLDGIGATDVQWSAPPPPSGYVDGYDARGTFSLPGGLSVDGVRRGGVAEVFATSDQASARRFALGQRVIFGDEVHYTKGSVLLRISARLPAPTLAHVAQALA